MIFPLLLLEFKAVRCVVEANERLESYLNHISIHGNRSPPFPRDHFDTEWEIAAPVTLERRARAADA